MVDEDVLQRVDLALVRMRRLMESSDVRRRFYARLGAPVDPSTIHVLRAILSTGDDAASVGDVAAHLMVDASTASRLVEQAVKAGYVARMACDTDRRRSQLRITAAGDDLLHRAAAVRAAMVDEWVSDWPEQDLTALAGLLERFVDSIIESERA